VRGRLQRSEEKGHRQRDPHGMVYAIDQRLIARLSGMKN
jgi:hypothetical protein